MEVTADAYTFGFEDCKAKMVLAYSLEGADAVQPGDPDEEAAKEAGDDGEEAAAEASGEAPVDAPGVAPES